MELRRFQVFGRVVVPLGVAGRKVELAGGDLAVERHGGELEQHERIAAELEGGDLAIRRRRRTRIEPLAKLDAIRKQIGLAEEHQHFLRQSLRQCGDVGPHRGKERERLRASSGRRRRTPETIRARLRVVARVSSASTAAART